MLVKDKARLDAATVLEQTWAAGFPVDPERIAAQIGIIVTRVALEKNVSGMIRVDPKDDPEIFVNANDPAPRQRFTIAHELGHYWEKSSRGHVDFNYIDYRSSERYDLHEFYADEFAGALLMPASEIAKLERQGLNVPEMAVYFGVSVPAMKTRLARREL